MICLNVLYLYLLLWFIEKFDTNISDGLIEEILDTSEETCQVLSALLRSTIDSVV